MHTFRPRRPRRTLVAALGAAVVAALGVLTVPLTATATPAGGGASPTVVDNAKVLGTLRAQVRRGTLHTGHGTIDRCAALGFGCKYHLRTTAPRSSTPLVTKAPVGWGATDLQRAYSLTKAPAGTGSVTVIGIGAYPTMEKDLGAYRKQYGLPACTVAGKCLTIKSYTGGPALVPSDPVSEESIAVETALDVQMVSAACPACKITYLGVPVASTNRQFVTRFAQATRTAVAMKTSSVTISYGFDADHYSDFLSPARSMIEPGTAIFSAAGDYGYMDPQTFQSGIGGWPQNLRSVVSTGGTTMVAASNGPNGYHQYAWYGAGSGCSPDLTAANGQPRAVSANCQGRRAVSDVAAVADDLAVYDTYAPSTHNPPGWFTVGGTSASSPFLAGLAARAPRVHDAVGPNVVYGAPASAFRDMTQGSNGDPADCRADGVGAALCTPGPGWDGATGRGAPIGLAPFTQSRVK